MDTNFLLRLTVPRVASRGAAALVLSLLLVHCDAALRDNFRDVLSFPGHAARGAFSDRGAWHGFALPDADSIGGFAGPFVHGQWLPGNHWLSRGTLARFVPAVSERQSEGASGRRDGAPSRANSTFVPGALRQEYFDGAVRIASELIFVGKRTAAARVSATNTGPTPASIQVVFIGSASVPLQTLGDAVVAGNFSPRAIEATAAVRFQPSLRAELQVAGVGYAAAAPGTRQLAPLEELVTYYTISLALNRSEHRAALLESDAFFAAPEEYFAANDQRWEEYLRSVVGEVAATGPTLHQRVAAKAVSTLVLNWRGATGAALLHDGCTPSITGFSNGFWSWDSWKHAAGLALFNAPLAANQLRAMFDHQGNRSGAAFIGMVPDKIGLPPEAGDAWGNTKPPLAAWATWLVYQNGKDFAFVQEVFPKLEKYHRWWYEWRDHDHNGICEFGSSGNNTMEMKWESGMDNAPRFDNTSMLRNEAQAWSADQESVDLNSFLYMEKRILAALAKLLGNTATALSYEKEADGLQRRCQERFFDEERGYFFDRRLGANGSFVGPMGCEGFAPLWSGLATEAQATRVRKHMLDPDKFFTKVPFPCVAADAPQFNPTGYWRGPVWLDQAYFAIAGLRRSTTTSAKLWSPLARPVRHCSNIHTAITHLTRRCEAVATVTPPCCLLWRPLLRNASDCGLLRYFDS